MLGVSVRTAQLFIEGGSLTSWKTPGGHRRVYRTDVLALIANHTPTFSSARVIIVASLERLHRFEELVSEVSGCSIGSYSDVHSASFAIGLRLPAVVVFDLEERNKERQALLQNLASNVALAPVRIILVGRRLPAMEQASSDRFIHVETAKKLPEAVRVVLHASSKSRSLIAGGSSFPIALNENQRLTALERSGLVDTEPEEPFDRLTWLASRSLKMPVALFTMLTATRQWFKSHQGLDLKESPRDWAFCNQTILQRDVFMVENLARSEEFAANPAVVGGPKFRFYAGAPVIDADGFALGSLCVIDYKPRTLDQDQVRTLLALASFTSEAVQLRGANQQLRQAKDALRNQRN